MTLKKVVECVPTLQKIAKCKSARERIKLLRGTKNSIFYAISEIALNTLNSNIRLTAYRKNKLRPHRNKIRKLALKTTTLPERKKIIIQSGGFLPSLLIPSLTLLAKFIGSKYLK